MEKIVCWKNKLERYKVGESNTKFQPTKLTHPCSKPLVYIRFWCLQAKGPEHIDNLMIIIN